MKIKSYLLGKFKRNKILVFLLFLGLLATLLGAYYNTIRESKTTYHYAFRDSKDKTQGLFFQRNTDRNEDKKVTREIFYFKKGSIINFTSYEAYYISDDNKHDKVMQYNFNSDNFWVIYENLNRDIILDLFISNQFLYVLKKDQIISINLENREVRTYSIDTYELFNEFYEIKNQEIYLSYDNCKFSIDKCNNEKLNKFLVFNFENLNIVKIDSEESKISKRSFYGTNKVYKLDTIKTYKDDEGNKNYNFRVFTQF